MYGSKDGKTIKGDMEREMKLFYTLIQQYSTY